MTTYSESNFKGPSKSGIFLKENFRARHILIYFKGDLSNSVTEKEMNVFYNTIKVLRIKKMGVKKCYGPLAWEYPNMNRAKNTPRIILHDFPHLPFCPFFSITVTYLSAASKTFIIPKNAVPKKQSNPLFLSQSNKKCFIPSSYSSLSNHRTDKVKETEQSTLWPFFNPKSIQIRNTIVRHLSQNTSNGKLSINLQDMVM